MDVMAGKPDYSEEQFEIKNGARRIAGVDEAGRGPLAGPVTAAAIVLNPSCLPRGLNDSKRLTAKMRGELHDIICATAEVSVAHATVDEIEALNILRAAHLAMERAIDGLKTPVDIALIDGNAIPGNLNVRARAIIKGDSLSLSISAASIVAKVRRDWIMADLAAKHPGYGWETNSGYGTKFHARALRKLGVTPHHRRTFQPVRAMLDENSSSHCQ